MDDSKISDAVQVFQRGLDNPVTCIPCGSNLIKSMKGFFVKQRHRTYPVCVLIGEPGSGKTTVAEATVIYGEENLEEPDERFFFITTDYTPSKLQKICKNRMYDLLIIDDFADFKGYGSRSKVKDHLDGVVRPSFAGNSAMLVLTVETPVIKMLTESLKTRMVIINADRWKALPESRQLIVDMMRVRPVLNDLLVEFENWAEALNTNLLGKKMDFYQNKQVWMEERSMDIFFTYDFAAEQFAAFLEEKYNMKFSLTAFRNNYMEIWRRRELQNYPDKKVVKLLFSGLIQDGAFDCKVPMAKPLCGHYCEGNCDSDMLFSCRGDAYECCYDYDVKAFVDGNHYDPFELVLGWDYNSAVLVIDPSKLEGMPEYWDIRTPILIVESGNFTKMMNEALERFCMEMNIVREMYNTSQIAHLLQENKMLIRQRAGGHENNTFPYLTNNSNGDRRKLVFVIRLEHGECELLLNNCKRDKRFRILACLNDSTLYEDCQRMPELLRNMCREAVWSYMGEESFSSESYKDIKM